MFTVVGLKGQHIQQVKDANYHEALNIYNSFIFSERDRSKEDVKNVKAMGFESIFGDNFVVPAMLYEPENANRNVMLYFHGGGWVRGSIDSHDCLCRKIANTLNIRVISVGYRLAPDYKFPIALNDALSAYCGIFNKKTDFDDIILAGDSSGGNLCAALCIKLREKGFGRLPMEQILFYPALSNNYDTDSFVKFGKVINLTKAMMRWYVHMYTGKDPYDAEFFENKLLYPVLETDMSVFPKTLIVSAEQDVLIDGQTLFADKLKKAGISVDHLVIEGSKHGFMTYGKGHDKYTKLALELIKNIK